jgi:hypothetical protein
LFGELSLEVMAADEHSPGGRMFYGAREALARRDQTAARAALDEITATNEVSSLEQIQAWKFLGDLGSRPPNHVEKQVLGVVVEAGMDSGNDVLAVYADRTAHYYNFSGSGVIWGRPDASLDGSIERVLSAASTIVTVIGPWTEPRRSQPKAGMLRLNILTPIGLHFGEGPFEELDRDRLASPLVKAATGLLAQLTSLPRDLSSRQ